MKSLAIVGAGRVGRALAKGLREEGWRVGAVVTRHESTARKAVRFIGAGRPCVGVSREVLVANVVLICTPDDAISSVAQEIAGLLQGEKKASLRGTVFLHTSGALDASALRPLKKYGAALGSLHPLQSFSGIGVPPLEGRFFAIEGDDSALRTARKIVRCLGGRPAQISSGKKRLYHAAAALSAGHVLAIEEAATRMLMSAGLARPEALAALLGLTRQVLDNFARLGSRAAWTGPLARGDYRIVLAHEKAMSALPAEYAAAYISLNRLAARVLADDAKLALSRLEKIAAN
ncbi:MAG TPA: DUF2520 domain-containing protein [Candidatus Dormibacteraeota bacterium]|nr:DUF2520 domain-containing protein [Candidatus Dormibacteraeota bacterium]